MFSNPSRSGIIRSCGFALLWCGWAVWAPAHLHWATVPMTVVYVVLGILEFVDWTISLEQTQHTHSSQV